MAAVIACSLTSTTLRAQEQPKPGSEHKKMEMCVGQWSYAGTAQSSPFSPAGKFKGKAINRMVLGGFFLETREEDKGDSGYIYQGIQLRGYDRIAKMYIDHAFENDGSVSSGTVTLSGNTWTSTGTRTDSKGKVYKTRHVMTYAPDERSFTFTAEYSPDDGKTWIPMWSGAMKRVGK